MVTLSAKLMAIHLPAFDERSQSNGLVLRQRAEHAKSMNGKFRNQGGMAMVSSSFHRIEQRVNTSSMGLLSISVSSSSTEGRAHSHSLEYETSVRKMTSSCTERRIHCQRGYVLMGISLCRQGEQRVSILWAGGLSGPVLHEKEIDWVSK